MTPKYRNQKVVRTPDSKTFFRFQTFNEKDYTLEALVANFREDIDQPKDIDTIQSTLVRFLLLLNDTVTFQCQVTVELIREQSDEVQQLHEYHKRWQAFTWSIIKMDELLIPLTKLVNKVYSRLYPGFPCNPSFSILRWFVNIWYREVYSPLEFLIEQSIVSFLKSFHQGCKEYSREKKLINKWHKNKSSLSDYFPDRKDNSPMFHSAQIQSVSPMLKSNNLLKTPVSKEVMDNERILEFEDGQHTIIDINMLYGEEPKTSIPGFGRAQKEIFKQILVDLIDISLNEFNMHYICHTEVEFGRPYTYIKDMIVDQFKQFFKYSVERMPFGLWNEVIWEHYQILNNILPRTLQKELIDMRLKFTKAYARSRVERNWKEFQKKNKNVQQKEEKKYQMFSTEASDNDPTILTEDEYQEIVVSDVLNTEFFKFVDEHLSKPKTVIYAFLAFMKNEEPEVIQAFNEWFYLNNEFYKVVNCKNRGIEQYKKPRGFPLKLGENEQLLFSFDHKITYAKLIKMKVQREKQDIQTQNIKKKKLSFDDDDFFEEWEELGTVEPLNMIQPNKLKKAFQPLDDGKFSFQIRAF